MNLSLKKAFKAKIYLPKKLSSFKHVSFDDMLNTKISGLNGPDSWTELKSEDIMPFFQVSIEDRDFEELGHRAVLSRLNA